MIATNNHRQLAPSLNKAARRLWLSCHSHPDSWQVGVAKFWVFLHPSTEKTIMKPTAYFASDLPNASQSSPQSSPQSEFLALLTSTPISPPPSSESRPQREDLRHILLGSPGAIRQTIHQLHLLNYAEPVLWSPLMTVGEQLIITPA